MILQQIQEDIRAAMADLWGDQALQADWQLTWSPDPQFGDVAANAAMVLARQLGKPPRELGEALAAAMKAKDYVIEATVAGPGFVNLKLTDVYLQQAAMDGPKTRGHEGRLVLVEYSDPNAFKPLHAGHLYTTLVGDMIARLLQRRGNRVVRLNYGGDVGLHVGRALWAIIQELGGEMPDRLVQVAGADKAAWLGACYAKGYAAYEDDETAQQQIIEYNRRVYAIHEANDHDTPLAQIYWECRKWSYDYFKRLYTELEVIGFDRFIPESEVTPLGVDAVKAQLEAGIYEKSDGAIVFRGEPYGLHTRVFITSQGLPTYETKDVGLLLTKWRDYNFDETIVITAGEQTDYMAVMLKSVEQFEPEPARRTRHLTHGLVKLKGGVKMSSRYGKVITALDILAAARQASELPGRTVKQDTVLAAVKYAFAKNRLAGDIEYDAQESVALDGNSGPYLQYAHARARSILAKSRFAATSFAHRDESRKLEPAERLFVRQLAQYGDVVMEVAGELAIHKLCTYLYDTCQQFNRFYEQTRVIGSEREAERIVIVANYALILRDGLGLLGIAAPDTI
jgi:arginyl-tRNA synthetase